MILPIFIGKVGWYDYKPLQVEVAIAGTENRVTLHGKQVKVPAFEFEFAFESRFDNFSFYGEFNCTKGLNYPGYGDFPDIAIALDDIYNIKPVKAVGGYFGVSWLWEQCFDTVFYAMGGIHRAWSVKHSTFSSEATPPAVSQIPWQRLSSFQIGAVLTFMKNYDVGFEYKHFWCIGLNHKKGNLDQFSLMLDYVF